MITNIEIRCFYSFVYLVFVALIHLFIFCNYLSNYDCMTIMNSMKLDIINKLINI